MPVIPRIGIGYDLHLLEPGDGLMLGGVKIPATIKAIAHSDGDALLHAITDAMLGALGEPDIGELFPDNDPENLSRDSSEFLQHALKLIHKAGYGLGNIDAVVQLQEPKLQPRKLRIRQNLARLCACDISQVNLKAKTGERVGLVGTGQVITTQAVVMLLRDEG